MYASTVIAVKVVAGDVITCTKNNMTSNSNNPTIVLKNGEVKTGQEAEAWLIGIKKYFQVQYYSGNMKAIVSIFNLNERESIWWEHFKHVKRISEMILKWK